MAMKWKKFIKNRVKNRKKLLQISREIKIVVKLHQHRSEVNQVVLRSQQQVTKCSLSVSEIVFFSYLFCGLLVSFLPPLPIPIDMMMNFKDIITFPDPDRVKSV